MKLGREIKARRLSVRDEHKFVKARAPSPAREPRAFPRMGAKQNARWNFHRAFNSGDVLLSHGLSPYYHRGCSVSLPCSEWERVVPLRYCHQSAEPHCGWLLSQRRKHEAESLGTSGFKFRKNTIFSDSLASTYRFSEMLSAFAKATA
jgi:hypothetical protein